MNHFRTEPAAHQIDADRDAALDALLPEIRARASEFARIGHVPRDMVEKLKSIGTYRALVPRMFGGEEWSPARFCRLIETLSTADGSVGWVASFGVSPTYLAALPLATQQAMYAESVDLVFAGALFPLQPAEKTEAGLRISGRWPFASGCKGAARIGVGVTVADDRTGGLPRVAVMPAEAAEIHDNWDVLGLRGTGSHDLVVNDVAVDDAWTFVRGARALVDAPLYRYPSMILAAQVLAVVGLGVARGALDDFVANAARQVSITGAPGLVERAHVLSAIGECEAALRAARLLFYAGIDDLWTELEAGREPDRKLLALSRLGATQAAREAARVVRILFEVSGTAAIRNGHRLNTALTDSLVVSQHAFLGEATLQNTGRVLLGQPTPPGFI